LDLGNSGGTSDEDDVVDVRLIHFGVAQRFLDRLQSTAEKIGAKILEPSASDGSVKIDPFEQRVNFDPEGGRYGRRGVKVWERGERGTGERDRSGDV
jgi:hypothetical protein